MRYGITYTQANALNQSRRRKAKKIKKRIDLYSTERQGYFLTLTFTDNVLNSTSEQTRRRYVARYLKANFSDYVANRDYGKTTEREHFHAVVYHNTELTMNWAYGFASHRKIKQSDKDRTKLAKYQAKLTNHALKKSGRLESIIYSRKK